MTQTEQMAALKVRYDAAKARATSRGALAQVNEFEVAVGNSRAVLCRAWGEVVRLAFSDNEVYATFYQRTEAGLRIPDGDKWDLLRANADNTLFGDEGKKQVRFGALSLDGTGVERYGECSVTPKESMIAHRASLIEENSVAFMKRHGVTAANDYAMPMGHQADWSARATLAVAKLADQITPATTSTDYSRCLLAAGPDGWTDHFMEVHIWGPLTIRSMERVTVRHWQNKPRKSEVQALREKLQGYNVTLSVP
ncbi:MAG: hypothetical protein EBS05_20205 [Proteobacteria bacterium]|nr:hypothetical protein [Pseudomonadota bacterium]